MTLNVLSFSDMISFQYVHEMFDSSSGRDLV